MSGARWLWLTLFLGSSGCIIGTWPTPEDGPREPGNDEAPVGDEACDDADNDGDGSVDEGCRCDGVPRGCLGIDDGLCGVGVQYCKQGYWLECSDIGPPRTVPRPTSLTVTSEASLGRNESTLAVRASVIAACPGIVVPTVTVWLVAMEPEMSVRAVARDDGTGEDTEPADGVYEVAVQNVFGPGVPSQTLTVRAAVELSETVHEDETETELVP